jgi:hypothetical protein
MCPGRRTRKLVDNRFSTLCHKHAYATSLRWLARAGALKLRGRSVVRPTVAW